MDVNLLNDYTPIYDETFLLAPSQSDMTPEFKGHIYISGPMRGYPEFNFPAFMAAQAYLVRRGWEVFNPAAADNVKFGTDISAGTSGDEKELAHLGFTIRDAMERDCVWIARSADAMYMLKGWEHSSGAMAEWALARSMKLPIYYQETI